MRERLRTGTDRIAEPRPLEGRSDPGAGDASRPPYVATAVVLLAGAALFNLLPHARRGFPSEAPPLFLQWAPLIGPAILLFVALAAALVLFLPRLMSTRRWVFFALVIAFGSAAAVSLNVQGGRVRSFAGCCEPGGYDVLIEQPFLRPTDYWANVALVDRLGPLRFAQQYPRLERPALGLLTIHATTHPPAAPIFLWALGKVAAGNLLAVSLLVVLFGVAGAVPTYFLAREAFGERVGRTAAILFACCPTVLIHAATSMDVVFMTLTAVALAALIRMPRSTPWAIAAGPLALVAVAFTWTALALAPIGLGIALIALRTTPRGVVVRRALVAMAAFAAGVLALLALGVDLVACYRMATHVQMDYQAYRSRPYGPWVVGNLVAFLVSAGLAVVALIARETRARWRERRPGLETVLWVTLGLMALAGAYRGETEHIWLPLIPLVVAVAAAQAVRLRETAGLGLGQGAVTQVLFYTNW